MLRLNKATRALLVLMCVLTIGLRVSGAHMHLCLDGSEPPVALHLQVEGDAHHADEHHADQHHNDIDLSAIGNPLVKKAGFDHELPLALEFIPGSIVLQPLRDAFARPAPDSVVLSLAPFLRPPPRGPPLPFSLV